MTLVMNVDKQTSTKCCMHLYYHHISVTDCGVTFNHIYNCQNRIKHMGDVTKNLFCVPALTPTSLLTFNMDKNEDKHQQQTLLSGAFTLQKKEYPGLATHSITSYRLQTPAWIISADIKKSS